MESPALLRSELQADSRLDTTLVTVEFEQSCAAQNDASKLAIGSTMLAFAPSDAIGARAGSARQLETVEFEMSCTKAPVHCL